MITREIIVGMKHIKFIIFYCLLMSFDDQSSELKKMQWSTKTIRLRTSEIVKDKVHNTSVISLLRYVQLVLTTTIYTQEQELFHLKDVKNKTFT